VINKYNRYQVGLTLNHLYPTLNGVCACGCGNKLSKNRKKWFSNDCRDKSFINFAIIKGDNSIIRQEIYSRDKGFCRGCGVESNAWEVDHILPVFLGGSACGLSNLQTLCIDCHKQKTFYNFPHHNNISSQAASIRFNRILYPVGQKSMPCLKMSKEMHSF
jgi:hypothetical protein